MSKLLRFHKNSDICFVTSVTYLRRPILAENANLMIKVLDEFSKRLQINILAYSILPDHIHLLVDCNGNDLSKIMQKMKFSFTKRFKYGQNNRKAKVWQSRFWDHIIRDQNDMNRHIDYIHYNPVKHGLTRSPFKWKYSSIHTYYSAGYYSDDWGGREVYGNFGE